MRRTFGASFVAALFLAGCAVRGREGGPVEIRYWTGWTGEALAAQRELVAEFNRTHPGVRVSIHSVGGSYNKVRIAFAGGVTPDVCSAVWADELAGYAMRGVLRPLDADLRRSGRSAREWMPGVWRMLQYRGHAYGLAVTSNVNLLVYNKRLFRETGLDPDRPPQTIAELDAAAAACTRQGTDGRLLRVGFRPSGLALWAYVFGGRWYDPATGQVTANDPGNVAALRWLASYGAKYDLTRIQSFEAGLGGSTTPNGPFFVGKVAIWETGEWALEHIRRYGKGMEWGWFPLPAPPVTCGAGGGRPWTTGAGGSVFVIPAATRHPAAAWEFLEWINRPPAASRFCAAIHNLPTLRAVAASPPFAQEPFFRFAARLAGGANVFGPPQMPVWPRYLQEIARAEDYALFGRQDPQRILDDLNTRMTRELARALRDAE